MIYKVTEEDVGYSGFELSDIGRYYFLVSGCIQFCEKPDDEVEALAEECQAFNLEEWRNAWALNRVD